MTPVESSSIQPAISRIEQVYCNSPYQQLRPLDARELVRHLNDRGISLPLIEVDALSSRVPPIVASNQVALWHPYQSWHWHLLQRASNPRIHWKGWIDSNANAVTRFVFTFLRQRSRIVNKIQDDSEDFYQFLHFLSIIEPLYLPRIRHRFVSNRLSPDEDPFPNYAKWCQSFPLDSALTDCELTVSDVLGWHRRLSLEADRIDDTRDWYLLIRRASYSKRNALRGKIRLAHDFYEMAEMVRLFLIDIGQDDVPRECDYGKGSFPDWQVQRYELENRSVVSRMGLRRLTRDFELDGSYKGFWYIEGETEEAFFTSLVRGLGYDLDEIGIRLMKMSGASQIQQIWADVRKRLRKVNEIDLTAKALRSDEVFTFLTIDDDPGISAVVQQKYIRDLFTAGITMWNGDFEGANFTISELLQAACHMMEVEYNASDYSDLEAEIDGMIRSEGGVGSSVVAGKVLEVNLRRTNGFETFSKGPSWGEALAWLVLNQPDPFHPERPAITALQKVFRLRFVDFTHTVQKR